ncbi:MAG: adenylate kinase [Methanobacteriaceae archaeon]|nr:adenylate kinase [Methanobacteriaceae archaeon]
MDFSWNIAAVVGVPGVGKTTICKSVSRAIGCHYVNYGDLMLEIAQKNNLASTDDEMFSLDINIQEKIWKTAALQIKELENVLVDLHGVDQSNIGYILSLPIEILTPDLIIIIQAPYEDVLTRRIGDKSKKRIMESFKVFKEHKNILKISMSVCSVICGCTFSIIENDDFRECQEKMIDVLTSGNVHQ